MDRYGYGERSAVWMLHVSARKFRVELFNFVFTCNRECRCLKEN